MRFLPYGQAAAVPNVIVDGSATENTVLTLSHWPKSGTPRELLADTSAETVFNYVDRPDFRVHADTVSNNHFDEDGLVGIFTLIEPSMAERHRPLLIDVARAGDFGVYRSRDAARIAFALFRLADPETSPVPKNVFSLPHPKLTGELYVRLLEILPRLLTSVDDYRAFWEREDVRLETSEALLDQGIITIEERPALDLAVVRIPADLTADGRPFTDCHPFAIHTRTPCTRLFVLRGSHVEFRYRYESWVQLASRRPALRVDLTPVADELNLDETSEARWAFDGVGYITPRLRLEGGSATSIPPDVIVARVERLLVSGQVAWNPYE